MIIAHEYPVCEYDTARDPIIHPTDFLDKCLPKKCIITFFRKELEKFAGEHKLPVIGQLHSEVLDIPIYKYESGENPLCITMPFSTAPVPPERSKSCMPCDAKRLWYAALQGH